MPPAQDDRASPPDNAQRISGQRLIIVAFVVAIAIAVVVILTGVFLIVDPGAGEGACDDQPQVCEVVHTYARAFNARDAAALIELLTPRGLRELLGVTNRAELEQRLARLTEADRIRDVEISRVSVRGDEATVVVRFVREDEGSNAVFSLVREGSAWRIDK